MPATARVAVEGWAEASELSALDIAKRFEDAGVDELILVMQVGTQPASLVLESIRTFGEKVLPHFGD